MSVGSPIPGEGSEIRVVLVGLGAVGMATLQEVLRAEDFSLTVTIDPAKTGQTIAGVAVGESLDDQPRVDADVALVATSSSFLEIQSQVRLALRKGLHVVSTCEELAYPWSRYPGEAEQIDLLAKEEGKAVVACGINPGFVMDALPVMLSKATLNPRSIKVIRRVNLSQRRRQLQTKMGVGLPLDEWQGNAQAFGHRGLEESAYLCAVGAGWEARDVSLRREPLSQNGEVRGVRETVRLSSPNDRSVELELLFEVDGENLDSIEIDGSSPIGAVFWRGVHGDTATVARLLNCARAMPMLPPGLRLPLEMPPWSQIPTQDQ